MKISLVGVIFVVLIMRGCRQGPVSIPPGPPIPEPPQPTVFDILTISHDSLILQSNQKKVIGIGVLNPTQKNVTVKPEIICEALKDIVVQVNEKIIESRSDMKFGFIFEFKDAIKGTYNCKIVVTLGGETYEKGLSIQII